MERQFIGLDASQAETAVCVVSAADAAAAIRVRTYSVAPTGKSTSQRTERAPGQRRRCQMSEPIIEMLRRSGVLAHVILPSEIALLLSSLELTGPAENRGDGILVGQVKLREVLGEKPLPGFDFALAVPAGFVDPAPFKLKLEPALEPTSFKLWVTLAKQGQIYLGFQFIERLPGLGLTGAERVAKPDGTVTLEPIAGSSPMLVCRSTEPGSEIGPALLIAGSAPAPASVRLTPDTDSTEGVVAFGLEPPAVVFGQSGIGFHCPAIVIDDSESAKGPGQGAPGLDPPLPSIKADAESWRGILARELDFYLPPGVPFFGGHPIRGYLEIPYGEAGVELVVETSVPPQPASAVRPARPGYAIRVECIDPTAKGLSGLTPSLISASMELPLDGAQAQLGERGAIAFAAGKPVRVTATLARDPVGDQGRFRIAVDVQSQGKDGLLSVTSGSGDPASSPQRIFNTAATMATALIADQNIPRDKAVGNGTGIALSALAAAGAALSSLFEPESNFVLHGAEIEASGHGLPVDERVTLSLDYSVAVRVIKIGVGDALSVEMRKDQPMRIRVRRVALSIDPAASGLDMIGLDFDRAEMEIENPGAWDVGGLRQLFDVVGSRSGRGSSWLEIDLRFRLNLGPIRVSGMTIRATLTGGVPEVSIRGMEARLLIPGAVDGSGHVHIADGGFAAHLAAAIVPLKIIADGGIRYEPPMVLFDLDVDLPAPIPLANSGFGLFGIGGLFGMAAEPRYGDQAQSDPVLRQLEWDPKADGSFAPAPGRSSFGLAAAVGTLPDLGFSFSAKAGLLITVPDVAVRGSLNGRVLQPPATMADRAYPPDRGLSFLGFIGTDANALDLGVMGNVRLEPLLEIKVPLVGHFPWRETDDWHLYLGADGYPDQGREIGPITARVLPGILDLGADAYLMLRGRGIASWPYGRALPGGTKNFDGFVVAFGFALQNEFGVRPVAWAQLYASLDLLLGAKPPTMAGFGHAGGSLHLGPFSLGAQARVSFLAQQLAQQDPRYLWAEVTGRIDLLFSHITGKVTISYGTDTQPELPPPDRHPLDLLDDKGVRIGSTPVLTDDSYRVLARLVEDPRQITPEMHVWPDAMISLPFAIAPEINDTSAGVQFPGVRGPGARPPVAELGSEMLSYTWRLDRLALVDVTGEADPITGAGEQPGDGLPACWQVRRNMGDSVNELLLLSTCGDLWVNRRSDGGEGLAPNPLAQAADLCHLSLSAGFGWAIGRLAKVEVGGFRLPPETISLDRFASRVDAHLHHFGVTGSERRQTALGRVFTLPQPYSLEPARIEAWPQPATAEREFTGHIVAPNLVWLAGEDITPLKRSDSFAGQGISLDLEEAITDGVIVLVGARDLFANAEEFHGVIVSDDRDRWERGPETVALPTGEVAAVFRQRTPRPVGRVTVAYPLGKALGVAGLGGVTVGASAAAEAENKAIQDRLEMLGDAAAEGPNIHPLSLRRRQRTILAPGRLYRLDVDMTWSGKLYRQDESGDRQEVESQTRNDQTTYTPRGGGGDSTRRRLFFRTTPRPAGAVRPRPGWRDYAVWLHRRQDVFAPEMIERHLGGYEPGQSEQFRFCDDPLRAHFRQDHVAALARAYGFTIVLAVRRIDRAGDEHARPTPTQPLWSSAVAPQFLLPVDRLRYEYAVRSTCTLPKPGATAGADARLDPEAWYELYVLAKSDDPDVDDGRLPGVTFRTSRWRTPEDMFAGLGLTVTSAPAPKAAEVTIGDLAVPTTALPGGAIIEDDDLAYQNALLALGLDGWPPATAPRLSRMWVANGAGGWLFAGLMIESPEPIHRPGRLDLDPAGLALDMGRAGAGVTFGIRRRDRSGSRLISLTANPLRVIARERISRPPRPLPPEPGGAPPRFRTIEPKLMLKAVGKRGGVSSDVIATLSLPLAPGFSEDP
jgi:hypothetical protein